MGDGPADSSDDNRSTAIHRLRGGTEMLEWRPRLIALLALVVLVAFSLGYELPFADNWEW
jgi:hypothetical protein